MGLFLLGLQTFKANWELSIPKKDTHPNQTKTKLYIPLPQVCGFKLSHLREWPTGALPVQVPNLGPLSHPHIQIASGAPDFTSDIPRELPHTLGFTITCRGHDGLLPKLMLEPPGCSSCKRRHNSFSGQQLGWPRKHARSMSPY